MEQKFSEVFDINPKLKLNKNQKIDFVEMKNIESGKRSVVSEYKKEFKGSGSKFERGDTLFARITPCLENGKISRYDGPGTAFGSTEFIVIRGKEGVTLSNFAYYYSTWEKFREFCIQNMIGSSGRQRVPVDALDNWTVSLPSLQEQKEIVDLLDSLDSKIELNQQMNETLDEIAKTLFKSWFIDFDPVRAKAEGRPTGLSKEISDLFPGSFEDSELGEIPTGWNYRSIYEDLNVIYGAPFSSKMFNSDSKGIQVIRIRDLKEQKSDIYTEEVHPKGVLIEKGDVVVGMDGEFRPYLWSGENAWMNQRICKFVPKHHLSSTFIIETLRKQLRFIELTEVATTVIHLGKSDIDEFLILNEGGGVIKIFNQICKPIEEKIISNNSESRKLEDIRDILLPKLISGELQITDAENLVEEAGI